MTDARDRVHAGESGRGRGALAGALDIVEATLKLVRLRPDATEADGINGGGSAFRRTVRNKSRPWRGAPTKCALTCAS
jgi:hypothetical protein